MIQRLVSNGCSYMHAYNQGGGHIDLANRLNIPEAVNLAQSGCANDRIIRTTLKDSYLTDKPTLYVLGITFVSRYELPILKLEDNETEHTSFEGRWTNPQNQKFSNRWDHFWSEKDTDQFVALRTKEVYSDIDKLEDLMYRLISLTSDLATRGHTALIFQQADSIFRDFHASNPRLKLFDAYPNFIQGLKWCAIPWQHEQGVPSQDYAGVNKYGKTPEELKHRKLGEHKILNDFLTEYIKDNILE